ncbi:MAG TPA: hypothetical protein VNH11_10305 [Pirellulales bacterium]|nr:hypothetical protein [Pirellulales bacterium]
MATNDQPSDEHQVGITNAQENNPDATIADLTRRMNGRFAAGEYAEAADLALQITALSKDELRQAFEQYEVRVLYLDHEAFGIYADQIEPTYDTLVDGPTPAVLAAATEFGKRHAQEMVLIAKKVFSVDLWYAQVHNSHAKVMSSTRSIDDLIGAFNAQAQAEGRYDSRTFWEVPARPGSIHDIPETNKSKEYLAWFRARRLAKQSGRARSGLKADSQNIACDLADQATGEAHMEPAIEKP